MDVLKDGLGIAGQHRSQARAKQGGDVERAEYWGSGMAEEKSCGGECGGDVGVVGGDGSGDESGDNSGDKQGDLNEVSVVDSLAHSCEFSRVQSVRGAMPE